MFALHRIAFAPVRKPYRIGILFTHKNGDFDAISATERSRAALFSKAETHISNRCSYYTGHRFVSAPKSYPVQCEHSLNRRCSTSQNA